MNREKFLEQLEFLLQDMSGDEAEEAISYYRDYFDEAGPENEDAVLRELGSPERIAAMIRADINGNLDEGGEFTERGYGDERFREPGYQVARRLDLPESRQEDCKGRREETGGETGNETSGKERRRNKILAAVLLVFLAILAMPVILGIGSGILGVGTALAGVLFALILGIASVTVALLIAGVVMMVVGVFLMIGNFTLGLLVLGMGLVVLSFGLLGVAVSILFYGKLLPALVRWIVSLCRRLFGGRKE